jgi:hypothetical protein
MAWCGTKSALLLLLAPFVFSLIMFIFRRRIGAILRRTIIPRVRAQWRFLAAPMIATGLFAMGWSYVYSKSWDRIGFLPEVGFPVVMGLFTYLTAQHATSIQRHLRGLLVLRDHVGPRWRLVAAIIVPSVVAFGIGRLLLTNKGLVTATGTFRLELLIQQLLVLVSILLGYLWLVPQQGSLVQGVKQTLGLSPPETGR